MSLPIPPAPAVPAKPEKGTPEYDKAMVESYDRRALGLDPKPAEAPKEEPKPQLDPMPEGGQAKFYDAKTGKYNWQAHAKDAEYRAVQKAKAAEKKPAAKPDEPAQKPAEGEPKPDAEAAAKPAVDWAALTSKVQAGDAFSDEDYATLDSAGIPREIVDTYLESAKVVSETRLTDSYKYVGGGDVEKGKAEAEALLAWAATSLEPAEIEEANRALSGAGWRTVIDGLKARRAAASPTAGEPKIVSGNRAVSSDTLPFKTPQEQSRAINDPRYKHGPQFDSAYHAQVVARINATNFQKK